MTSTLEDPGPYSGVPGSKSEADSSVSEKHQLTSSAHNDERVLDSVVIETRSPKEGFTPTVPDHHSSFNTASKSQHQDEKLKEFEDWSLNHLPEIGKHEQDSIINGLRYKHEAEQEEKEKNVKNLKEKRNMESELAKESVQKKRKVDSIMSSSGCSKEKPSQSMKSEADSELQEPGAEISNLPLNSTDALKFTTSRMRYRNESMGVTIDVPEGAIKEGFLNMKVKVALCGPFSYPDDLRPVSAVLLMCPQQEVTLSKPIRVILPLIIDSTQSSIDCSLTPLKAYHHNDVKRVNRFDAFDVKDLKTFKHKNFNYSSFLIAHFCYVCLASGTSRPLKPSYCFSCIKPLVFPPNRSSTIHFCVSFCMEACLKTLSEHFPASQFDINQKYFTHEDLKNVEYIKLREYTIEGWTSAVRQRKVLMRDVEFWHKTLDEMKTMDSCGMYPPRITLEIKCCSALAMHKTTKAIFNFNNFESHEVLLTTENHQREQESTVPSPPQPTDKLEKIDDTPFSDISEDIADIMEVLTEFDIGRWRTLATSLRLRIPSMNNIETKNSSDTVRCLQLALTDWLRLNYNYEKNGRPSWKKLAKAMRPLDGTIFEKIVSKFPVK